MQDIRFDIPDRTTWFRIVNHAFSERKRLSDYQICISDEIKKRWIKPYHLVTLAYLIDALKKEGNQVSFDMNRNGSYIYNELHFKDYFSDDSPIFTPMDDDRILGLWRVNEPEIEIRPRRIQDYLKRVYFPHKDLSAVGICLTEAYYNIFDHSESTNNAWSMVWYDERDERLWVAVCDCGIGIPESVRKSIPGLSDRIALKKALEDKFTTKSKSYNGGMGLGIIKDSCTKKDDYLRIHSGNGVLRANKDSMKITKSGFQFQGTLLYYRLSLNQFEDEQTIDDFTF